MKTYMCINIIDRKLICNVIAPNDRSAVEHCLKFLTHDYNDFEFAFNVFYNRGYRVFRLIELSSLVKPEKK